MSAHRNALRRWAVRRLLGDNLALEKRDTPNGVELQLIDTKRRINYGFWLTARWPLPSAQSLISLKWSEGGMGKHGIKSN